MKQVCQSSRTITVYEGEHLFNQGDQVHWFFYVVDGVIKLFRESPQGQEKILEIQRAGGLFAEALMCAETEHYPVTAAAINKSTVIAISTREFRSLLRQSTDTCLSLLADLSQRLHAQVDEIERISVLSGRNRVAAFFLDLYLRQGSRFSLEVPKNAIASVLSLQPETFSRLVKELRSEKIIEIKDSKVEILDEHALRRFAGIA
jgi:CRP-like cAMP-binding protein